MRPVYLLPFAAEEKAGKDKNSASVFVLAVKWFISLDGGVNQDIVGPCL